MASRSVGGGKQDGDNDEDVVGHAYHGILQSTPKILLQFCKTNSQQNIKF